MSNSGSLLRTPVVSSLSLVGFPRNSCPYYAIYFPPQIFPIQTCLCFRLADRHQGTLIAALRGELSHPELSGINSRPGLGSIG